MMSSSNNSGSLLLTKQKASEDDIGGTSNRIAKGISGKESKKIRKGLKQTERYEGMDKERLNSYLHSSSSSDYHSRKRRQHLRDDDNDSNLEQEGLNPTQRRALRIRQKERRPDRILQAKMNQLETKRLQSAMDGMDAELILNTEEAGLMEAETEMERTYKMSQNDLKKFHLNEQTSRHIFDLKLEQYNPYGFQYDRSGRCGLLYGKTNGGHVSLMDMHTLTLKKEFYLDSSGAESIRDATFLHNTTLFALAQKKNVFIYDEDGVEIHRLHEHIDVFQCQFLPYHWLLTTVGRGGHLKYHDTSTGQLVSSHRTKMGPCKVMRQNRSNAVIHLGHTDGKVTLWSPASREYLVKLSCHRGSPIHSLAIDPTGRYMVTGAADCQVKIWDLRMYKETHSYSTFRRGSPTSIDISQRGILGIAHGSHTTFYSPNALKYNNNNNNNNNNGPYMSHSIPASGPIETIRFRPFEDVCAIGHTKGMSSIVIPGSGDPNLDSMEYNTNPFQDTKQRREAEVRALLDKLSPDMISLDPDVVGTIQESSYHRQLERTRDLQESANQNQKQHQAPPIKEKKRMRGKNKLQKKLNRKMKNVIDANKLKLQELKEQQKIEKQQEDNTNIISTAKDEAPTAIKRFFQ